MDKKQHVKEGQLEEAFISAFEADAELRATLAKVTAPRAAAAGDWSCCIHVKSN